jgi:hypothetical protein
LDPAHRRWVPFFVPSCACSRNALVATQHNASSEKKQRGDDFAALLVLQQHISLPPMPNGAKPRAG